MDGSDGRFFGEGTPYAITILNDNPRLWVGIFFYRTFLKSDATMRLPNWYNPIMFISQLNDDCILGHEDPVNTSWCILKTSIEYRPNSVDEK